MATSIVGIGTCSPDLRITQDEAFENAQNYCGGDERKKRALKHLYGRATIKTRGVVLERTISMEQDLHSEQVQLESTNFDSQFFPTPISGNDYGPSTGTRMEKYEEQIASLALVACERALEDAQKYYAARSERYFSVLDIKALVTVSCTGFYSPGLDIEIINKLKLDRGVSRTNVGYMGCHGAMNGLRVADALSKAGAKGGHVLLCAAEICSIHFHYGSNNNNLLANSLFADGSAALVLGSIPDETSWSVLDSASYVVPETLDAMSWKVRDNGFEMTLSASVPELIEAHLHDWLEGWLHSLGMKISDVSAWAVHPGGPKIVDAVGRALALNAKDLSFSYDVLQNFGNMSSPTVFFILERIRASLGCVPTVVLAFGPGLTIEAAFLSAGK